MSPCATLRPARAGDKWATRRVCSKLVSPAHSSFPRTRESRGGEWNVACLLGQSHTRQERLNGPPRRCFRRHPDLGSRLSLGDSRIRSRRFRPLSPCVQAHTSRQGPRTIRPTCATVLRRDSVRVRTAQGAPERLAPRPRRHRALHNLLGFPLLHHQLHPLHLWRLPMAQVL